MIFGSNKICQAPGEKMKRRDRERERERERGRIRKRCVNTEILKEESIVVPYNS